MNTSYSVGTIDFDLDFSLTWARFRYYSDAYEYACQLADKSEGNMMIYLLFRDEILLSLKPKK